jgi:hypothetical protein
LLCTLGVRGQQPAPAQPAVRASVPQVTQEFISVDAPVVALQHVRVIDGTVRRPRPIRPSSSKDGRIKAMVQRLGRASAPAARVLDLSGRTA